MTDLNAISKTELRAYTIEHPEDKSAFQFFVDRFTSEADSTIYSISESLEKIKEVEDLIRQKLTQAKKN